MRNQKPESPGLGRSLGDGDRSPIVVKQPSGSEASAEALVFLQRRAGPRFVLCTFSLPLSSCWEGRCDVRGHGYPWDCLVTSVRAGPVGPTGHCPWHRAQILSLEWLQVTPTPLSVETGWACLCLPEPDSMRPVFHPVHLNPLCPRWCLAWHGPLAHNGQKMSAWRGLARVRTHRGPTQWARGLQWGLAEL